MRFACILGSLQLPSYGALTIIGQIRTAFDSAAPGLPTETFAAGLAGPGGTTTCNGPTSSETSNECFLAGGLLPGVTYDSSSGTMAILGVGYDTFGNNGKIFGADGYGSSLNLTFSQASAVGFRLFAGLRPVGGSVSVFSPEGALLGSFSTGAQFGGAFTGIISDSSLIGKVSITEDGFPPVVGDLSFGVPATAAPEPSAFLLSGAALTAVILWRRRVHINRAHP